MRVLLAVLAMLVLATPAFAQSTATPVLPGLLVSSPCNPGQTVCFAPYSNSNPLPMTCVSGCSGGGGNVTIVNPLGRSADAASVSTALSTEDVAALTPAKTSGTPCATATTAGCSIPDAIALTNQIAGGPIFVGPAASPTALIQATASVPITFTAAGGPTQIIAASGSTKVYITHWDVTLSGAGTFALVTGTGTNCGSNTAYLTGASGHPLSFAANGGISSGSGLGPVLVTIAGGEVCAITTGSVDSSGSIAYAQF